MDYTKGEWKKERPARGYYHKIKSDGGVYIGDIFNDYDANLVVAAPDMYKVLQDIRDGVVANQERLGHERFENLLAAIRKVEVS
uniref:Uncharacterized protein n=1 Tax=viral metagenome TaxID=1070528 RepID=A0A6M3LNG9_9ZZZZ